MGDAGITSVPGRPAAAHAIAEQWQRRRASVVTSMIAALLLSGCTSVSILEPGRPIASANGAILYDSLAIMSVIIVPTIFATLAFAWWFRAGNTRARYRPEFAYSGRIEIIA